MNNNNGRSLGRAFIMKGHCSSGAARLARSQPMRPARPPPQGRSLVRDWWVGWGAQPWAGRGAHAATAFLALSMAFSIEANTSSIDLVPSICGRNQAGGWAGRTAERAAAATCSTAPARRSSPPQRVLFCHRAQQLHSGTAAHLHQLLLVVTNDGVHVGVVRPQAVDRLLLRVVAALHLRAAGGRGRRKPAGEGKSGHG